MVYLWGINSPHEAAVDVWETESFIHTEITHFFLFSSRFPNNVLFTSASGELWKMVRIGGQPLGFGEHMLLLLMFDTL